LTRLVTTCRARGASILLAQEETGDLIQYTLSAADPSQLARLGVKAGEGFLAASLRTAETVSVADPAGHASFSERVEGTFEFQIDGVLALPLDGENKAIGAIGLFSKIDADGFGEEDAALLRLVGANVSTAVRLFNAKAAREREERLTSIGRLLSQVIHDFKTPMTVISGYAQLMADSDESQQRAEYCEMILKQFDVLTTMQREVLEFARGQRGVFVRRVYMRKFFADIQRQLELELEGKPIELELKVDPKLVARFDEGRVARAIFNLSRNAVEAMGASGGGLTIEARRDGGDLLITVSDTGPGIPEEIADRLFQSFVTAGKEGGTGLGLAIVKKIVDEHEGSVSASSTNEGACFELRLPQPEPQKPKRDPRQTGASGSADSDAAKAP
jgi:signal transduction histidine kinase